MNIKDFAELLDKLENESSRNLMVEYLAEFFKKLEEKEIQPVFYMITGRVVPSYIPVEFNFSTKLIQKSLAALTNVKGGDVSEMLAEKGDIGSVAEAVSSRETVSKKVELSILDVYGILYDLAILEGKGSQEAKQQMYLELFTKVDPLSIRYITRIITGKLRLGTSHKTILDAISWAVVGDKGMRDILDRAYGVRSDIGVIAKYALRGEVKKLEGLDIEAGIPVASKLVEREKSAEAAFERLGECVVQPKYDGLRTQIHFKKDGFDKVAKSGAGINMAFDLGGGMEDVRIFSRNMESLTAMFPDIVDVIRDLHIESIVLDAESIGYDKEHDKFIPFQETMTRKRKYGIKEKSGEYPVKVFVFDILFINGRDLSRLTLTDRLGILSVLFGKKLNNAYKVPEGIDVDNVMSGQEVLEMANSQIVDNEVDLNDIFRNALARNLEGVIVKKMDSEYIPGTRTYDWIKLKANTYEDLVDSVDCVVLGYYYGRGARARFGVGAFLVGVYNEEFRKFQSIAKVGSGVKDDEWKGFVEDIEKYRVENIPKNVEIDKEMLPDVICEPKIVVVVDADEVSKSKKHSAGRNGGVGYSLRFPRLRQWGRLDKDPEQITTVEEVEQLYKMQGKKG